jgi:hypothetical protein
MSAVSPAKSLSKEGQNKIALQERKGQHFGRKSRVLDLYKPEEFLISVSFWTLKE